MTPEREVHPAPISPGRRHFMAIAAASAGRLSKIAVSASVVASVFKPRNANAMGGFPKGAPGTGGHNCFRRGTLIRTAQGETPVEELANGDLVMTTNGALPVKWIGRQTMRRNAYASWHPNVLPVRVSRFAIDDQTPRQDLYVSQEHVLLVDGVLIPAKHLVNGCSIAFEDDGAETIEYFSVEFHSHQVIFAEGMAAESFRYTGGQLAWDNLAEYESLYGRSYTPMPPAAPICRYDGGRAELRGLLRLAAARVVDIRDPIPIAHQRIAARALATAA